MDKQIKYLLGVLIILLISAYFVSLLGDLPHYFKDDIIAFLEERASGEISFSSVSLWPLNRLKLKSFSFEDKNNNKFRVEELNLNYSFNFSDSDSLFKIDLIEAKNAEITVNEECFNNLRTAAAAAEQDKPNQNQGGFKLENLDLPQFMTGTKINIIDSSLVLKNEGADFELRNFNLGLSAESTKIYTADLSTAVSINTLNLNDLNLAGLNGDKLELQFNRKENDAELYFNTENFALSPLISILDKKSYNYNGLNLDLSTLTGQFSAKGELRFKENSLKDYKSEVYLNDSNFTAFYSSNNIKERLDFKFDEFKFLLSGPDFNLAAADNKILLGEEKLNLSLKVDDNFAYQLKLSASNFQYDYNFLKQKLQNADFDFDLNLEGKAAELNRAYLDIKGSDVVSEYGEIDNSHLNLRLLADELFLKKAELNLKDGSRLNLKANYNLKKKNYQLQAEAEDFIISPEIIDLLSNLETSEAEGIKLEKLRGDRVNLSLDTAGYISENNDFSSTGSLKLGYNLADKANSFSLDSKFYYTQKKLLIDSLKIKSDFGRLDLMGELNFASANMQLRYAAHNFEPAVLNRIYELNIPLLAELNPELEYFEGRISNSFSNPTVSLDMQLPELNYENYTLRDLDIRAVYSNDNLALTEARASINQGLIRARGEINNISSEAVMDLELESENLYFSDLRAVAEAELPLSGEIQLSARMEGPLKDYDFSLSLNTADTVFNYQGEEFEISNLSANILREKDEFKIDNFSFEHQNLVFKASGLYSMESGFDVEYNLSGFELQDYLNNYPDIEERVNGGLALSGRLLGEIGDLSLDFNLSSESLSFDGFEIKIKENNFNFNIEEMSLTVEEFNFDFASGSYRLGGEFSEITSTPRSDLDLEVLEFPSREIFQKYLNFYPFAEDLIFSGDLNFSSAGSEYSAILDLGAAVEGAEENSMQIKGEVGNEIAVDFSASALPVNFSTSEYGFNIRAEAALDFSGSLRGTLNSAILNLSHSLTDVQINNTALQSVNGDILVESRRRFSVSETVEFVKGGKLDIDGSYNFGEKEINLSSNLKSLPVNFILSFFGDQINGEGELNGNFSAQGNLESPDLNGSLTAAGSRLNVGIWAPVENYRGTISLKDNQAVINNFSGDFVDGDFELGGAFNLFDLDNFWDLTLSGEELYFNYGSLEGPFDPELEFKGPLSSPLLSGRIELYNFEIAIPFKWPAASGEEAAEDAFIPRIDLELIPTTNVRVKNQNMNVLVENGDLSLDFNHRRQNQLMMDGRLRSSEGRFNYYNSRFSLNSAEIRFTPVDEGDIPNLQVNATTYASGNEINVNLSGPANDMRINFSSNPEMTEEEILNLLSSRGALGSAVVGGESLSIQQIILQELVRLANGFLQEDLISDIESDFQDEFSLDRMEIDAFNYGLEREFAIYLGENLNSRLYLEYAAFFTDEGREDEISFQYRLTNSTKLKGTYFGDDEYQISIESEIEF